MSDKQIEKNLYLARISHLSGQPEVAIKYIEELIKLKKGKITEEERNILFSSLKKLINFRREAWRTVNAVEIKESTSSQSNLLQRVKDLKHSLVEEINSYIEKALDLIDNYLLKDVTKDELKVIYAKTKGDYQRYKLEITPKDKEEEINEIKSKAENYYKEGLDICDNLGILNSNRLGIILNYTVFLYESIGDKETAFKIANEAYQNTLKAINEDNYDLSLLKDLNELLKFLKENISKWMPNSV